MAKRTTFREEVTQEGIRDLRRYAGECLCGAKINTKDAAALRAHAESCLELRDEMTTRL